MPRLDGFEVCRRLKKERKEGFLPVVILTVLQRMDEKIKVLEMGADDFLTKPFNEIELATRLKNLLRTKELYDRLQKSYQSLKELEQLKENLTNMIVHDLRIPLTSVLSSIEVVAEKIKNEEEIKKCETFLQIAQENCKKLVRMISDLLDISKLEENRLVLKREKVGMDKLIWESVKETAVAYKKKTEVEVCVAKELPHIFIDRELIMRVLMNLLANALKFTPPEGKIKVEAVPLADSIKVSVYNEGEGIPSDYLDKIFEKFVQVETRKLRTKAGVGLGLTFCQLAVKAHGGRIWAESQEGKGSRFIFTLPYRG